MSMLRTGRIKGFAKELYALGNIHFPNQKFRSGHDNQNTRICQTFMKPLNLMKPSNCSGE